MISEWISTLHRSNASSLAPRTLPATGTSQLNQFTDHYDAVGASRFLAFLRLGAGLFGDVTGAVERALHPIVF